MRHRNKSTEGGGVVVVVYQWDWLVPKLCCFFFLVWIDQKRATAVHAVIDCAKNVYTKLQLYAIKRSRMCLRFGLWIFNYDYRICFVFLRIYDNNKKTTTFGVISILMGRSWVNCIRYVDRLSPWNCVCKCIDAPVLDRPIDFYTGSKTGTHTHTHAHMRTQGESLKPAIAFGWSRPTSDALS